MRSVCLLAFLACILSLAGCITDKTESVPEAPPGAQAAQKPTGAAKVDFVTQVKPIIRERCVMCHNRETLPTRHSFETAALAMKGDSKGPIIVPGKPEESRFIVAITVPEIHETAMPPVSSRITPGEIETLKQWIREGAHWPKGRAGRVVPAFIPRE